MPRGGARPGAGRKVGPGPKRQALQEAAAKHKLTPLDYMLGLLNDEANEPALRFEAAKAAAPYLHPRLASIEHSGELKQSYVVEVPVTASTPDEWSKQHAPRLQ